MPRSLLKAATSLLSSSRFLTATKIVASAGICLTISGTAGGAACDCAALSVSAATSVIAVRGLRLRSFNIGELLGIRFFMREIRVHFES